MVDKIYNINVEIIKSIKFGEYCAFNLSSNYRWLKRASENLNIFLAAQNTLGIKFFYKFLYEIQPSKKVSQETIAQIDKKLIISIVNVFQIS